MLYRNYLIIYLSNLTHIDVKLGHPFQIGNKYLMYQNKNSRMHSLKYHKEDSELIVPLIT